MRSETIFLGGAGPTVEETVSDQPTRVIGFAITRSNWLALAVIDVLAALMETSKAQYPHQGSSG